MSATDAKGITPWRVGGKALRTLYDANDRLVGVVDTPDMATLVVEAVNAYWGTGVEPKVFPKPAASPALQPAPVATDKHGNTLVPCATCGDVTAYIATETCDPCWEKAHPAPAAAPQLSVPAEPRACGWPTQPFGFPCNLATGHKSLCHPFTTCKNVPAWCVLPPHHVGDCEPAPAGPPAGTAPHVCVAGCSHSPPKMERKP